MEHINLYKKPFDVINRMTLTAPKGNPTIAELQRKICLEYFSRHLKTNGKVYAFLEKIFFSFALKNDGQLEIKCDNVKGQDYGESAFRKVEEILCNPYTLGFIVDSTSIQRHLETKGHFLPEHNFANYYDHKETHKRFEVF